MFCKHKWEVKVDKLTPSPFERLKVTECEHFPLKMVQGTHLVIMACTLCGKLDKTETKV